MTDKESLYNRIASANIMSDGMLKDISYGDFALMMVLKDRANKPQKIIKIDDIKS
ncbi:hypothetical protein [Thermohalobacter berrensis]|uniref:hypothetical protein n=1 Tax=Thermohalobacter berrensis TaxID=99594 RepID=UPI0016037CE6|nr:hypothetical protein [Thermohalobacter berrensis]